MVLTLVAFFIYGHLYVGALFLACFELVFNTPAIILSRYLYLLTFREKVGSGPTPSPEPSQVVTLNSSG
jgi:hypothetical protein